MSLVAILFSLLSLVSCKKENESTITIAGTISDSGGSIAGAEIQLAVKEITGGTYSNTFTTFHSGLSATDGSYSHTFDAYNAIEYKVDVLTDNRFDQSLVIDPDDLKRGQINTYNFVLQPQAWFKINLQNSSPVDSSDFLLFQLTTTQSECAGCCNNLVQPFAGEFVDTTLKCMTTGNVMLHMSWIVTKFGIANQYEDSLYCATGDTAEYSLSY
jgi:predicted 3-demethylubiquinone-9 3-methyltransferase (glyoxalase superfamily)